MRRVRWLFADVVGDASGGGVQAADRGTAALGARQGCLRGSSTVDPPRAVQMQGCLHHLLPSLCYRLPMLRESLTGTGPLTTALDLHRQGLRLIPLVGK